ncbi:MAG: DUF4019 domain-containing protein [Planctomycetota bacterium]|jgi:hypothetical protein
MRIYLTVAIVVAIIICAGCGEKQESNPEAERAATEAAEAWLELVDSDNYSQIWQEAAALFRSAGARDNWEKTFRALRTPMGKLVSREVTSTRYTTLAPGAPDGQYVIIQYKTSFENKLSAIETVTPVLEQDGKWRVFSYYIK